ncbi:MAG TPA: hypothetical protein VHJ38_14555 [Nitrososphaeraceae archaeon]|nr:hypothetical protein [Nitrososphaeraceae archaeon]
MSFQEDEKEIVDPSYKQQQKEHLTSIEFNIGDYMNNINYKSNFPLKETRTPPRNFDGVDSYEHTIKTMKEIKYNFLEEHKNIINTYYSIYSNRLNKIFECNLNNLISLEKYSQRYSKINKNLLDNQSNTTRVIDDIVVKNMDTFIKALELVQKFYCDVLESYCNYITMLKNSYKK